MNMGVRRQISVLRECFSNASHWVCQQIPTLREWYYNAPHTNQLMVISAALFTLILPIYFFVSMPPIAVTFIGILLGVMTIDFFRRDRYPALKRWIIETEHGQINGTDSYHDKELKQDTSARPAPRLRWSNTIGFVPPGHKQCCDAVCKEVRPPSIGRRVLRIFGRIFSYRIFPKWQSLQLFDRLYVLAFTIAVLGFVSLPISGKPTKFLYGSFLLAYGISGIGFGIWLWPWLQRIWHWRHGKLAIMLLHGGILFLSIIHARLLVAEALGLPPQDFDMTVGFCVLLFYLPLWLIVFDLLAVPFALVHFVASGLCSFTTYFPINVLVLLIAKLFPVGSRPRLFLEQNIGKFVWRGFIQMLGVMGIAFGIMIFWDWYSPAIRNLKPVVRAVAYFADFQQVSLYPGVDVNRRLRLHENGVVSYAEERGWDIVISVEKVQ